ncbi:multiple myeloma tumor-associated protein 2 homolog [Centruroides sculpturatus]|uniref:multiple myeloma tumor-associated protein 2 homolog n=1 Tax=Centruroides sculpturatus TaxID=218467 RepID=UPI000C6D4E14|nr:multiple myeloma tumor-associated protein 2 homolog [Centruroides sculpturatus]
MHHPSRGGVRGGADQFSWDSVKTDKYRENYLGHSLKAPVGRWQKGKDLQWYNKDRDKKHKSKLSSSERDAIRQAEDDAMNAALGHKPIQKEQQVMNKEVFYTFCFINCIVFFYFVNLNFKLFKI